MTQSLYVQVRGMHYQLGDMRYHVGGYLLAESYLLNKIMVGSEHAQLIQTSPMQINLDNFTIRLADHFFFPVVSAI